MLFLSVVVMFWPFFASVRALSPGNVDCYITQNADPVGSRFAPRIDALTSMAFNHAPELQFSAWFECNT